MLATRDGGREDAPDRSDDAASGEVDRAVASLVERGYVAVDLGVRPEPDGFRDLPVYRRASDRSPASSGR
jgi:hypothetical protein